MQTYTPSQEVEEAVQHPYSSLTHPQGKCRRRANHYHYDDHHHDDDVVLGDLPPAVRDAAVLRHPVIAWTTLDPDLADRLCCQACCSTFGPALILPCFWPHLLILFPCLLMNKLVWENRIRSQYWILTERELKVVTMDYATTCCCFSSGNQVKSIPLDNITDCGVDSVGQGCLNQCYDALPNIYVDTASSGGGFAVTGTVVGAHHEAVGIGLHDHAYVYSPDSRSNRAWAAAFR